MTLPGAIRVLALMVALATLAGCVGTSTSYRCSGSQCEATLTGAGAKTKLDALGVGVTLVEVSKDEATLEVGSGGGGKELTLSEGDTANVGGLQVSCERIEGPQVTVALSSG